MVGGDFWDTRRDLNEVGRVRALYVFRRHYLNQTTGDLATMLESRVWRSSMRSTRRWPDRRLDRDRSQRHPSDPDAGTGPSSPIAGMSILYVDKPNRVIVIKLSLSPRFAGMPNPLFSGDSALMLFADWQEGGARPHGSRQGERSMRLTASGTMELSSAIPMPPPIRSATGCRATLDGGCCRLQRLDGRLMTISCQTMRKC